MLFFLQQRSIACKNKMRILFIFLLVERKKWLLIVVFFTFLTKTALKINYFMLPFRIESNSADTNLIFYSTSISLCFGKLFNCSQSSNLLRNVRNYDSLESERENTLRSFFLLLETILWQPSGVVSVLLRILIKD